MNNKIGYNKNKMKNKISTGMGLQRSDFPIALGARKSGYATVSSISITSNGRGCTMV